MAKGDKPTHNVLLGTGKDGKYLVKLGAAWPVNGGFSCQLEPGVALTNKFVILEVKDDKT